MITKFIGIALTIFQKMILVPVLSLILYGSFITYSFFEYQKSNQKIQELRDNYIPMMDLLNINIHLFSSLRDTLKDTVLAQEPLWLIDAKTLKIKLDRNLELLEKFSSILNQKQLQQSKVDLNSYYSHAHKLAKSLLHQQDISLTDSPNLVEVEHFLHLTSNHFEQMKSDVQNRFMATIGKTSKLMNQLLFWGGIITISSMLILITVTFALSLSTRKSFITIVERTKLLASGDTDFSKRLTRSNRDELGVLIHWFNKLSDKLEVDYLKLKTLSITDKLTQLNNRTRTDQFLPSTISYAIENNESLVLVIIDIDHFKQVNDTFGHLVGDDVLQVFAKILKSTAKSGDYISRWGGEEFVLVWQNIDVNTAIKKANEIRNIISKNDFPTVGNVTASMGLTLLTDQDSIESLISRADSNLYKAKENGRNCVIIDNQQD